MKRVLIRNKIRVLQILPGEEKADQRGKVIDNLTKQLEGLR